MQQIEHGILAALIVTCGGVDGHTTIHLQCGAVVPYLREVAVGHLVYAVEIALVALLVADDEDVGERYDVAIHVDVGGILHTSHTIDVEGVAVHLRSELIGGVAPHAVLAFLELGHARSIVLTITLNLNGLGGQEIACYLYLHSLGCEDVECDCAVLVDDG